MDDAIVTASAFAVLSVPPVIMSDDNCSLALSIAIIALSMYIPIAIRNSTQYVRLEAKNNKLTILFTSVNSLYLQTVYGIK